MNTKAQHTPGPWDFRTGHAPHFQGQIYDSNGHTIAISYNDESGKNTQLIAAAPELLAALECLLDCVTDNRTHGPEVDAAAAAIAKARQN